MTGPEGGFFSTQDADSEGEEGRFYVWTPDEIRAVLGETASKTFCYIIRRQPGREFRRAATSSIKTLAQRANRAATSNGAGGRVGIAREVAGGPRRRVWPDLDDKVLVTGTG